MKKLLIFVAGCFLATVVYAAPQCDDLPSGGALQDQCLCNFVGGSWCDGRTRAIDQCPAGTALVNSKCIVQVTPDITPAQCEQVCQTDEGQCMNAKKGATVCQNAYNACVKACNK